jgi:nitrogen-specific signal transduction histidine kinase
VGVAEGHRIVVAPFVRGTRAGVQFLTPTISPVTEALWQPFVASHTIPGSGLGMAVARSMAKALEVSVELRDVPDHPEHTRLVLTLPVAV